MKQQYPWLFEELWSGKMLDLMLVSSLATAIKMLSKVGGHEKALNWLEKKILPNLVDVFAKNLALDTKFRVICHGDCWNNNIIFRYNDSGLPVEVMLLDVQINKVASLATDLNYFMFASLTGSVRKPNVDRMLTDYYASFRSVIEGCNQVVPFTKDEIVKEYKDKNSHGLIFGCMIVPPIVMESEDVPDLENITSENFEQFQQDWEKLALDSIDKNPLCKPRFLSMFDEMLEEGLFS